MSKWAVKAGSELLAECRGLSADAVIVKMSLALDKAYDGGKLAGKKARAPKKPVVWHDWEERVVDAVAERLDGCIETWNDAQGDGDLLLPRCKVRHGNATNSGIRLLRKAANKCWQATVKAEHGTDPLIEEDVLNQMLAVVEWGKLHWLEAPHQPGRSDMKQYFTLQSLFRDTKWEARIQPDVVSKSDAKAAKDGGW